MGIFRRKVANREPAPTSPERFGGRGWVEGLYPTDFRDGLFMLENGPAGSYFIFAIVDTHERDGTIREQRPFWSPVKRGPSRAQTIDWKAFDWVQLCDRSTVPQPILEFHWEVFESTQETQLIMGRIVLDTGDDWRCGFIGDATRSSADWIDHFRRNGVKILESQLETPKQPEADN